MFYASLLPIFIDLSNISLGDAIMLIIGATLSAGGLKLLYAYIGDRTRLLFLSHHSMKIMNISAAAVMISTGLYLVL